MIRIRSFFGTRGGAHSDGGSRLVLRSEQVGGLLTEDHVSSSGAESAAVWLTERLRRKPHR